MALIHKIIMGILALITCIAVVSATAMWYRGGKTTLTTTQYTVPPQIKVVEKIKRVNVPGPVQIVTVEKQVVVEKLKLPAWISGDVNEQVIATAEIPPYAGKTNAAAILNTSTGKGDIVAKQVPLPLFGFESVKEIGIRGGIDEKAELEGDVYGRWDFLRVGNVHVGAYVEGNTRGEGKAMVSAGYKW